MSALELLPDVPIDLPPHQEPTALAVFWTEICASQPLPVVKRLFASHPTTIVLAGEDARFRSQQEQIDQLPVSGSSSVLTIEGADHYFSGGYRRKVVERLAGLIRLEKVV